MTRKILFIDNFDSFTFNLVEAFERLGCDVAVLRNTIGTYGDISAVAPRQTSTAPG